MNEAGADTSSGEDFMAVQADQVMLDGLARRDGTALRHADPIAALMVSLTTEIDRGLDSLPPLVVGGLTDASGQSSALIDEPSAETDDSLRALTRRRFGPAARLAAVTAGLLVASSGVAAAVTGNPIGPLQHVVDSLVHHGNGATVDSDGTLTGPTLPTTAATAADLNVLLVGVARAIATGQCDVAATKLADAQAALTALPATSTADPSGETAARAAFQGRIDALTQRLASAHTCSPTSGANSHGRGQSGTHATGNGAGDANGHHGGGNAQPNGTGKSSTGTSSPRSKPTSKPTSDPTSEPTSEPTSAPSPQSTVDNAPHATGGGSAHAPS